MEAGVERRAVKLNTEGMIAHTSFSQKGHSGVEVWISA